MSRDPQCAWCGAPVYTPHPGWQPGHATYCEEHRAIVGRNPYTVGQEAISDAIDLQDTDSTSLIRWPWRSVHELAGVLVPKRVHYIAAFPSNGKTTMIAKCYNQWTTDGIAVTYVPLESDPLETMTRVACMRAGVSSDEALSLRLKLRAEAGDRDAQRQREALHEAFQALRKDKDFLYQFRIDPTDTLSLKRFEHIVRGAVAMESQVLILDHVDHAEGDDGERSPAIQISNQIQMAALKAGRRHNMVVVLATQLNSSRAGGDRMAHYRPPPMDWLTNKDKKEQIAAVCLGLYRPMDPDKSDQIAKVRAGLAEPHTVAKPQRMGVAGMKLRFGGDRKERTVELAYVNGTLSDLPPTDAWADESSTHGIRTHWEGP